MRNSEKGLTVAIIGCGDIAGGYDERRVGEGVFTHAGAYSSYSDIKLKSAYDPDIEKVKRFCKRWGCRKACLSLEELLEEKHDIVSICSPDDTHEDILEEILNKECARAVWMEKPLTMNAQSAQRLIDIAKRRRVSVYLSNQRRWEPEHCRARCVIEDRGIGDIVHVTAYYVKGITHIGCTAIDTIRFLCGDLSWAQSLPPYETGSYRNDPSLRGEFGLQSGGAAIIVGCDAGQYVYSLFEVDIVGTHGRLRFVDGGDRLEIYRIRENEHYSGFNELVKVSSKRTELHLSMRYLLKEIRSDILEKRLSVVTAEEGVRDLEAIAALKESVLRGGETIRISA